MVVQFPHRTCQFCIQLLSYHSGDSSVLFGVANSAASCQSDLSEISSRNQKTLWQNALFGQALFDIVVSRLLVRWKNAEDQSWRSIFRPPLHFFNIIFPRGVLHRGFIWSVQSGTKIAPSFLQGAAKKKKNKGRKEDNKYRIKSSQRSLSGSG